MAFLLLNCFELSFLIVIGPKSQLVPGKQTLQNTVRQVFHGLDTLRQALYGLEEERVYPVSGANFSVSLILMSKFATITYIAASL